MLRVVLCIPRGEELADLLDGQQVHLLAVWAMVNNLRTDTGESPLPADEGGAWGIVSALGLLGGSQPFAEVRHQFRLVLLGFRGIY